MPTYGAIRRDLDKQTTSTDADAAAHFAEKWISSLEEFEQRVPCGRFEQVQWLRSLAKIATKIDRPADENEAAARRRLGELCRFAMTALHRGAPDAAQFVREASAANSRPRATILERSLHRGAASIESGTKILCAGSSRSEPGAPSNRRRVFLEKLFAITQRAGCHARGPLARDLRVWLLLDWRNAPRQALPWTLLVRRSKPG